MKFENLDQLLNFLNSNPTPAEAQKNGLPVHCGEIDYCHLPVFSQRDIADTTGIYSWDDTRMLVPDKSGNSFKIIERIEEENI